MRSVALVSLFELRDTEETKVVDFVLGAGVADGDGDGGRPAD